MVTQIPAGNFESCDVSRHYAQNNEMPEANPDMTTSLVILATATGADRAIVAALTKSLAELTDVTKADAEELRWIIHSGHISPLPVLIPNVRPARTYFPMHLVTVK
jgi:hypothetical protein